jgi:hypothetical protein
MKLLALSLLAVVAGASPHSDLARSTPACPTDDVYMRGAVLTRISDPDIRRDIGLTAVDPSHLRVLSDPADTAACQTLRGLTNVSPDWVETTMTWSYYTADGYYFAAGSPNTAGTDTGLLFVFDSGWRRMDVMSV